jgi:DNA-directed RNA polymerase specialized sigma24 family protein
MNSQGSVTNWINRLKSGDQAAAQELWQRYFSRLMELCRKKLGPFPRRAADEEDVVVSAFMSFFEGVRKGKFPLLKDRDTLWPLLVVISARKAATYIHNESRQKRGRGLVRGESALEGDSGTEGTRGLEQIIGDEPTPEFAALVAEEYEELLVSLQDDSLRTIARFKMEGYENKELAGLLNCSLRTVERKLKVIRTIWGDHAQ